MTTFGRRIAKLEGPRLINGFVPDWARLAAEGDAFLELHIPQTQVLNRAEEIARRFASKKEYNTFYKGRFERMLDELQTAEAEAEKGEGCAS